jgi:hypothetical protein
MNWVIIGLTLAAIIIVSKLIHFKHIKHRVFAILIILSLLFTYLTFSTIVKSNSLDIKTAPGIFSAVKLYSGWVVHAFGNLKIITGNAIKMNWLPQNGTYHN